MSLVRNEQTKLTATLLNSVAVAAIAVGTIAPIAAAMLGTTSFSVAFASGAIWLIIASIIHYGARMVLRRLVE